MKLHSFTYLKILCLCVCYRVLFFLLVSKYRTNNWKMLGVYFTAYDMTYATYSMHLSVQKMNSLYPNHSSTRKWQITLWCAVILHLILTVFWVCFGWGSPWTHSHGNMYFFIWWSKKHFDFWYLITDIDPFSTVLIFKKLISLLSY